MLKEAEGINDRDRGVGQRSDSEGLGSMRAKRNNAYSMCNSGCTRKKERVGLRLPASVVACCGTGRPRPPNIPDGMLRQVST